MKCLPLSTLYLKSWRFCLNHVVKLFGIYTLIIMLFHIGFSTARSTAGGEILSAIRTGVFDPCYPAELLIR